MNQTIKNIGRFEIIRILGKGAQSLVYLAYDPNLQREVAIKALHFPGVADRQDKVQALIQESRTVSQLRHPNIVPIFEAGEHEGDPYLVFEYVEGQTLAKLLQEQGARPAGEAVEVMISVLEAIAHAHQHGIIHRDLKPSNILIGPAGVPRVMDFGIAARISDDPAEDSGLSGTPSYMAPEYIQSKAISEKNDIFAAGLILCEIVASHKAVPGRDIYQIMDHIASKAIELPSGSEIAIDEKLGDIILKALARNPLDRYASAQEMRDALRSYLMAEEQQGAHPSEGSKQSTLDFLLRRMRHKSDFPALSESVSAINRITSSEMESINKLSNSILKDFALTYKILKMVNTAFYKSYGGGTISTISRAVIILGFDAVRNIAITLILFEHLQNKSHAAQLKDEFLRTLFSAILARNIAILEGMKDPEETFVCALFHNLGRLLSMFYFPEEANAVTKTMAQKECSEDIASTQVLGISYEDMGIGIARIWGFPEQITNSMRKLPSDTVRPPQTLMDKLRIIAGFSGELCDSIAITPHGDKLKAIRQLAIRFGDQMPIAEKQLPQVLEKSLDEITQYAATVRTSLQQSPFGKQIALWTGRAVKPETAMEPQDDMTEGVILAQATLLEPAESQPNSSDARAILTAGIQDISNSLVDSCSLNDILRMILETMYRSMGFQHVLLCIKDGKQNTMQGRFGFGADINQIAKNFKFPLGYSADVFHAAISKGVDILISDINDPKIKPRIPDWYRKAIASQTFVLFPLNIKNVPVALIYADKEQAGDIVMPEDELSLLRTLRNQAILAIRQSF
ncbi:MAG: HDOD domain-containing protein [Sulfuricella sp.]|nr:HDOD domain-containing protein [Sulfuricella sp.]